MTYLFEMSLYGLQIMLLMGFITWIYSLQIKDVSIVDSLWSLMFLAVTLFYAKTVDQLSAWHVFVVLIVSIWAIRLSAFLTLRNWGEPEDRRYREIRQNNQPNFDHKSLYLVFGLQALLAWIISTPLMMIIYGDIGKEPAMQLIFFSGAILTVIGVVFESVADYQLYQFKKKTTDENAVLDTGLWAFSRHPNYFGEFLVWWGIYLFALSTGAWWTLFSPIIMTLLLLKVSGVSLMEKEITKRRAKYQDYIDSTNAFFPWKPKKKSMGTIQNA